MRLLCFFSYSKYQPNIPHSLTHKHAALEAKIIYLDNFNFHLYMKKILWIFLKSMLTSGIAHELHCLWICKTFLILAETNFLCLIQNKIQLKQKQEIPTPNIDRQNLFHSNLKMACFTAEVMTTGCCFGFCFFFRRAHTTPVQI